MPTNTRGTPNHGYTMSAEAAEQSRDRTVCLFPGQDLLPASMYITASTPTLGTPRSKSTEMTGNPYDPILLTFSLSRASYTSSM